MSWTKLMSAADWDAYKVTTAAKLNAGPHAAWGDGPRAYPCLAVSTLTRDVLMPGRTKVLTCFVLEADARDLLNMQGGVAAGDTAATRGSGTEEETEFRRYVAANLLAIVHELRSVKITNAERYESVFNKFLAGVDQATVSRAAAIAPAAIFADGGSAD